MPSPLGGESRSLPDDVRAFLESAGEVWKLCIAADETAIRVKVKKIPRHDPLFVPRLTNAGRSKKAVDRRCIET